MAKILCKCGVELDPMDAEPTVVTDTVTEVVLECAECGQRWSQWLQHTNWTDEDVNEAQVVVGQVVYHPDPAINEEVKQEMNEAEATDLEAGYPPAWWKCPECGASHKRGFFQTVGVHRCAKCGYVGDGGVMAATREELGDWPR